MAIDEPAQLRHAALTHAVEQFYYREARYLDERQFMTWLGNCVAEDIRYTVPARFIAHPNARQRGTEDYHALDHELARDTADGTPLRTENLFHLAIRAERALKPNAWAENPPARTVRTVGNVEVEATDTPGEYTVHSTLQLAFSRHGNDNAHYTARRTDTLREIDGAFKIAAREVVLDWNVIVAPTVGLIF